MSYNHHYIKYPYEYYLSGLLPLPLILHRCIGK